MGLTQCRWRGLADWALTPAAHMDACVHAQGSGSTGTGEREFEAGMVNAVPESFRKQRRSRTRPTAALVPPAARRWHDPAGPDRIRQIWSGRFHSRPRGGLRWRGRGDLVRLAATPCGGGASFCSFLEQRRGEGS